MQIFIDLEKKKVEEFLNDIMRGKETLNFYAEEEKMGFRKRMKELGIESKNKSNIPSINLINKFFKDHRIKYELIQGKVRLKWREKSKKILGTGTTRCLGSVFFLKNFIKMRILSIKVMVKHV